MAKRKWPKENGQNNNDLHNATQKTRNVKHEPHYNNTTVYGIYIYCTERLFHNV